MALLVAASMLYPRWHGRMAGRPPDCRAWCFAQPESPSSPSPYFLDRPRQEQEITTILLVGAALLWFVRRYERARTRGVTTGELFAITPRRIAVGLCLLGGCLAIVQWYQIAYRLHLFFGFYRKTLGMNHVDNSTFLLIHIANAIVLPVCIGAAVILWRDRYLIRFLGAIPAAANAVGWAVFIFMRVTGILVPISVFMENTRIGQQ